MNKIILSLITVLAIASLSIPVFAGEQMGRDSNSAVLQNPTLTGGEGSAMFLNTDNRYENKGIAGTSNNREENTLIGRADNPTLNWSGGAEIFRKPPTSDTYYGSDSTSNNHYGLAPVWGFSKDRSAEVRMDNPTLQGIFENVE